VSKDPDGENYSPTSPRDMDNLNEHELIVSTSQGLAAEWIALQSEDCGSIPVYGRFDNLFSKEFNLTMLTIVYASTWSGL